jgi:deoxyribodipyrimidine photo-lyase
MTPVSIFIFHRDFRLHDNTSLNALAKEGWSIIPLFVFTPEQIHPAKNPYFSAPAVQFMCESLEDLSNQCNKLGSHLCLYEGNTVDVLQSIQSTFPNLTLKAVGWNEDYSVFAKKRDAEIQQWCEKNMITCIVREDYGLMPLRTGLLPEERPYMVLSQFYKKVLREHLVQKEDSYNLSKKQFFQSFTGKTKFSVEKSKMLHYYTPLPQLAIHGGRTLALKILERIRKGEYRKYKDERDYPALSKTTKASPHLKFGNISVREMYWTIKKTYGEDHALIRELVFRDFYLKIYAIYPELQRGKALREQLDKYIPWSYNKSLFEKWCQGKTGYPLVDAGMRELNETGHQHNRIRMLCSSVLTKYFLIDWRWGLKYYYQHLVDADIYSNTAGWGFSSSTGADAVPYFRAPFNPFIQSEKFDKGTQYIHHWVPELKEVSSKDIHHWFDPAIRTKYPTLSYPAPIIDHKEASAKAMRVFKEAGEKSQLHKSK